jgi:hypothetical protein
MAQGLHSQKMWEELAEDPFRGLRAGPATFSPFLFLPSSKPQKGVNKLQKNSKWRSRVRLCGCLIEEKA